eukprot:m.84806 g.84806  ORF g.84806 m.84806 type:complete len:1043 (+) comp8720_c1_seq1:2936-6064(+)
MLEEMDLEGKRTLTTTTTAIEHHLGLLMCTKDMVTQATTTLETLVLMDKRTTREISTISHLRRSTIQKETVIANLHVEMTMILAFKEGDTQTLLQTVNLLITLLLLHEVTKVMVGGTVRERMVMMRFGITTAGRSHMIAILLVMLITMIKEGGEEEEEEEGIADTMKDMGLDANVSCFRMKMVDGTSDVDAEEDAESGDDGKKVERLSCALKTPDGELQTNASVFSCHDSAKYSIILGQLQSNPPLPSHDHEESDDMEYYPHGEDVGEDVATYASITTTTTVKKTTQPNTTQESAPIIGNVFENFFSKHQHFYSQKRKKSAQDSGKKEERNACAKNTVQFQNMGEGSNEEGMQACTDSIHHPQKKPKLSQVMEYDDGARSTPFRSKHQSRQPLSFHFDNTSSSLIMIDISGCHYHRFIENELNEGFILDEKRSTENFDFLDLKRLVPVSVLVESHPHHVVKVIDDVVMNNDSEDDDAHEDVDDDVNDDAHDDLVPNEEAYADGNDTRIGKKYEHRDDDNCFVDENNLISMEIDLDDSNRMDSITSSPLIPNLSVGGSIMKIPENPIGETSTMMGNSLESVDTVSFCGTKLDYHAIVQFSDAILKVCASPSKMQLERMNKAKEPTSSSFGEDELGKSKLMLTTPHPPPDSRKHVKTVEEKALDNMERFLSDIKDLFVKSGKWKESFTSELKHRPKLVTTRLCQGNHKCGACGLACSQMWSVILGGSNYNRTTFKPLIKHLRRRNSRMRSERNLLSNKSMKSSMLAMTPGLEPSQDIGREDEDEYDDMDGEGDDDIKVDHMDESISNEGEQYMWRGGNYVEEDEGNEEGSFLSNISGGVCDNANFVKFAIGRSCLRRAQIYHQLHHFAMSIFIDTKKKTSISSNQREWDRISLSPLRLNNVAQNVKGKLLFLITQAEKCCGFNCIKSLPTMSDPQNTSIPPHTVISSPKRPSTTVMPTMSSLTPSLISGVGGVDDLDFGLSGGVAAIKKKRATRKSNRHAVHALHKHQRQEEEIQIEREEEEVEGEEREEEEKEREEEEEEEER